ncbi:hypothetical protein GDO81_008587 [Engystomops pustulosus]|uniref:Uncharacterized protein n=1 Tax=Engystomops pustulosus TaxID=76066 RepID=A0AAV7CGX7_ENGPU|nr:hypothetical protein GDO81_008587 [Engystomops pustulosus]
MVTSLSVLTFLVSLLYTYVIPKKEQSEAICSKDACYTVHLSQEIFSKANEECKNRGGTLLTIHSEEEAQQVYRLLAKFTNTEPSIPSSKLWIGLHLKAKSCVYIVQALKGFSWITDSQDAKEGQYSNWLNEPKMTCVKERCVSMKLHMDSPDNYKWSVELCSSHVDGYICKFTFQGMCPQVALAGPGHVEYNTLFDIESSSLDYVPHGSSASVTCGHNGEFTGPLLICIKSVETNVYHWSNTRLDIKSNEPFCAPEELGCKYNNGGCEHECVEYPQNKSLSCRCRDGYVLAPDSVSCVSPDHCQSNPCEQTCINQQYGFECSCDYGFTLAENKVNCKKISGCLKGECDQRATSDSRTEEMQPEYNDTTRKIKEEKGPRQATSPSIRDTQNGNERSPKIIQPTPILFVKTTPSSETPVNDASGCSALQTTSKLLLSVLCISVVLCL